MSVATTSLGDTARAFADVFRNPGLRRIQLAFAGSVIGDWAYMIAVSVYAYAQGGATAVGVLAVVRYTAAAIVTPFSAMLADRMRRKVVMISADILRAAVIGVNAAVIAAGGPDLAVYALLVVVTVSGTPFRPAQAAILPGLARDPAELTAANATASTVESVGFFVGPALGGLLLEFADVETVLLFNALTFVVSAVLVLGVREATAASGQADGAPATGDDRDEGFLRQVSAGFRTIFGDTDLRLLVALFSLQCAVAGASAVFVVTVGLELLDVGPSGVGYLDAVSGIGGLVGGVLALPLARRNRLALDFGMGVLLWGAPLALIAIWPSIAPAAIAFVLVGLGNSIVDINAYTILQRVTPGHVMGRVFGALDALLIGSMALGALVAPLLIHLLGIRGMLATVGAAVGVGVALGLRGLTRIDARIQPPVHVELLRRVPLFTPLPESTLERLAYALREVQVAQGDVVFHEGDHGDRYYVIASGEASILGTTFGPGEGFGEIALLRDVPRTATVTALSDLGLLALERDDFLAAVTGHGDALAAADALVATRLRG